MNRKETSKIRTRFFCVVGVNPKSSAWARWSREIGRKGMEEAIAAAPAKPPGQASQPLTSEAE